jgi:hypothetical protein
VSVRSNLIGIEKSDVFILKLAMMLKFGGPRTSISYLVNSQQIDFAFLEVYPPSFGVMATFLAFIICPMIPLRLNQGCVI